MNREKEVKAYLEGKLSQAEKLKYEIADEMGVLDKLCILKNMSVLYGYCHF